MRLGKCGKCEECLSVQVLIQPLQFSNADIRTAWHLILSNGTNAPVLTRQGTYISLLRGFYFSGLLFF